jgi:hypothetical protein
VSGGAPPRGCAPERRVATRFARLSIPLPGPQAAASVLQVNLLIVMYGASPQPFRQLFEPLGGAAPKGHLVLLLDQSPKARPLSVGLAPLTCVYSAPPPRPFASPLFPARHLPTPSNPRQVGGGHFTATVPVGKWVNMAEAQRRVAEGVEAMPPGAARLLAGGSLGGVASWLWRAPGGGGGGGGGGGALQGEEAAAAAASAPAAASEDQAAGDSTRQVRRGARRPAAAARPAAARSLRRARACPPGRRACGGARGAMAGGWGC